MISRDLRTITHALVLVAAVLAVMAAALWYRGGALEAEALGRAQPLTTKSPGVPDSGRQRQMIIAELKQLNSRMQAIESALREGDYVVQTKPAAGAGGAAAGGGP